MAPSFRTRRMALRTISVALAVVTALGVTACSDDDDSATETADTTASDGTTTEDSAAPGGETCGETISLGYSAWPGWFPWAVAEDQGLFEENGVDVDLRFFADYLGSLDAMVAGELDGNSQTLNDTMLGVASGSEQVIVITNDNSTGNDAIIVDESITSVEDLAGKTVAAEAGVVDHFLLLQGLADAGMTEDDIDFRGVLTDAAAAGFAAGEFDAVGVVTPELIEECPGDVQALVNTWYATMDFLEANPEEATAVMAELSPEEYAEFDAGTTLFSAEEALESFGDQEDNTSLQYVAGQINPFLVEAGLIPEEADTSGLFDASFTQAYVDSQ